MPEYVQVATDSGDVVYFELTDEDLDGPVPAGRRWDLATEQVEETLERGIDRARSVAESVVRRMRSMPSPAPDKVAVEIGLKVTAGTGVAIAKCSSEAHVKIIVEWQRNALAQPAPAQPAPAQPAPAQPADGADQPGQMDPG